MNNSVYGLDVEKRSYNELYRMSLYNRRNGSSRSFGALLFDEKMPAVPITNITCCFSGEKSLCMVIPENFFFDDVGRTYTGNIQPDGVEAGNPVIVTLECAR